MQTFKSKRVSSGHYEGSYKGHRVELINLALFGDTGWIVPIDGSNDIEPRETKRDAMAAAARSIDAGDYSR